MIFVFFLEKGSVVPMCTKSPLFHPWQNYLLFYPFNFYLLISFIYLSFDHCSFKYAVFRHLRKHLLHLHSLQIRRTNCKNCVIWSKSDNIGKDVIKLSKDVVVSCVFSIENTIIHIPVCYLCLHGCNQGCYVTHTCYFSVTGWLYCHGWLVNWQKN
jgi:hypothetical protein